MTLTVTKGNDQLTERSRRVWSAGDYDRISAGFRHEAQAFVDRRGLKAGQRVLDAACGTGNLTIPAARAGAKVTGLDLIPSLLGAASEWAAGESLNVQLDEGSVEDLPYGDAQFDVVLSMFGVTFAARPDRVVAELARVTRRGGQVALANWTRSGFIGQLFKIQTGYVPPPPDAISPLLWGDEKTLRERFDESTWKLTVTPRMCRFRYPHTPAGTAELFRNTYGPTVKAFEALDEDRRAAFAVDLAAHWSGAQKGAGSVTEVDSEYLEVVAVRR